MKHTTLLSLIKNEEISTEEMRNTWRKIGNKGCSALGRQNPGMRIGPPCKAINKHKIPFYF